MEGKPLYKQIREELKKKKVDDTLSSKQIMIKLIERV